MITAEEERVCRPKWRYGSAHFKNRKKKKKVPPQKKCHHTLEPGKKKKVLLQKSVSTLLNQAKKGLKKCHQFGEIVPPKNPP